MGILYFSFADQSSTPGNCIFLSKSGLGPKFEKIVEPVGTIAQQELEVSTPNLSR